MSFNEKKITKLFGILVFLFATIPYLLTVQPTVSFWDCGEFIACSYTLGVPHPPGTPFFVLIGRVVCMMLFFIKEVAFRINLISVFSNALSVFFIFLIVVKMLKLWLKKEEQDNFWFKLIPYIGGFTSALFVGYSYTWWFNCVEAEVYGVAMLILNIEIWMTFKWFDYRQTKYGDRILVFIMYIAYLGIGVHLYTMIPIPFIFLFVIINDETKRKSWQLWLIGFSMLSVMYSISSFLIIGPVLIILCLLWLFLEEDSAKKISGILLGIFSLYTLYNAMPKDDSSFQGLNFILGLVYMALAVVPFFVEKSPDNKQRWNLCFWFVVAAFLGYSIHLYIPIRSFLDPMIDENNPEVIIKSIGDLFDKETWKQFIYFVERKQYGSESMIVRMFNRRGQWFNQFFNHAHMGFGSYMAVQFFNFNDIHAGFLDLGNNGLIRFFKLIVYLLPFFTAIWAMIYQFKRNRNSALFLILLFFACTVGLVLYMNFSDGTVPDHKEIEMWERSNRMGPKPQPIQMEVRERDYFYTPGYMFLGIWLGIGLASLLHFVMTKYKDRKKILAPLLSIVILATPVIPLSVNMPIRTRAGNWVAYDYAFNLLQSCEKDAVLFTNGDNDTFPVWFAQEVAGIRRDVRVVNLSLLNTNWYIEQLIDHKPKLNIPTVLFDGMFNPKRVSKKTFVKEINHSRNHLQEPRKVSLSKWNLKIDIPSVQEKRFFKVQDYMVLNIVHGCVGKRPIYFAVTVSDDNLMGLKPYLSMEGIVYKLTPNVQNERMDMKKTLYNLDYIYRFKNLLDKDVFLSKNTRKLLNNYAAAFVNYTYQTKAEIKKIENEIETIKESINKTKNKNEIETKSNQIKKLEEESKQLINNMSHQLEKVIAIMPKDWKTRTLAFQIYMGSNQVEKAINTLKNGLALNPDEYIYNVNLGLVLRDIGRTKEAVPYLEDVVYKLDNNFKDIKHRETVRAITSLIDIYKKDNDHEKGVKLLQKWLDANPADTRARQELNNLEQMINAK